MISSRLAALATLTALTLAGCSAPAPLVSSGGSATDQSSLATPAEKEIAMELVSSAENSSLDWKAQYGSIQDFKDGCGYTAGIIGFCSATGDMLALVKAYTASNANNPLANYLPALEKVNDSDSHEGLGSNFTDAWKSAAADPAFQKAQELERDSVYFDPAVARAQEDGLGALGQFIYFDAIVMHGNGDDPESFGSIRASAMDEAKTPAQGGDQSVYLNSFLDARVNAMQAQESDGDVSQVEDAQRVFLREGNLSLTPPLKWKTYGDSYSIP
jgi:chitosanase